MKDCGDDCNNGRADSSAKCNRCTYGICLPCLKNGSPCHLHGDDHKWGDCAHNQNGSQYNPPRVLIEDEE